MNRQTHLRSVPLEADEQHRLLADIDHAAAHRNDEVEDETLAANIAFGLIWFAGGFLSGLAATVGLAFVWSFFL